MKRKQKKYATIICILNNNREVTSIYLVCIYSFIYLIYNMYKFKIATKKSFEKYNWLNLGIFFQPLLTTSPQPSTLWKIFFIDLFDVPEGFNYNIHSKSGYSCKGLESPIDRHRFEKDEPTEKSLHSSIRTNVFFCRTFGGPLIF